MACEDLKFSKAKVGKIIEVIKRMTNQTYD